VSFNYMIPWHDTATT